jgi:hypothetical protein
VLVLPYGGSAHLELGYAAGVGQRTAELMYLLVDRICLTLDELLAFLRN